jgi:hypothetical protein
VLAALQAACAASPVRSVGIRASAEPIVPTCDTSVGYFPLLGRISNTSGHEIDFHLDDFEGPPFDPSHMAYRVYAAPPGEPLQLVHNSGHDSIWDRTLAIVPGDSAMFNIPIFGLRPADYYNYFRVEFRDSRNRSYWTREFQLCAVAPTTCACPGPVSAAAGATGPRPACASAPQASLAMPASAGEISLVCR